MTRKTVSLSITVPVDDGVTPEQVKAVLVNQVWFCAFSELVGGTAYWREAKVFAANEGKVLRD